MAEVVEREEIAPLSGKVIALALGWFWGAFVTLNTLRAVALGYDDPIGALERRLVVAGIGVALSWAMYRMLVRCQPASLRAGILLISAMSLPAALVFSTSNFLIFDMLTPIADGGCHPASHCTMHDLVVNVSDELINWAFVFVAWGLLYFSIASAAQTRAADLQMSEFREIARLAQIRALRYQINPHFLFNVLNSLTALVSRRETAEAEALIGEVGNFFRYGLATDPVADVMLGDEIDMQRRYLELERRRFPNRLSIAIDIAADAMATPVPPLILQPLVENAIKHGLSRTDAPVTISIRAIASTSMIELLVEDDAPGMDRAAPAFPMPDGFGVGLRNVAERLSARFGAAAQFTAGPMESGGFRARILVPLAEA